jgi:hypothetical protein
MNGAEDHFRNELQDDERVLWTGHPELSPLFAWSDLFFIPYTTENTVAPIMMTTNPAAGARSPGTSSCLAHAR